MSEPPKKSRARISDEELAWYEDSMFSAGNIADLISILSQATDDIPTLQAYERIAQQAIAIRDRHKERLEKALAQAKEQRTRGAE